MPRTAGVFDEGIITVNAMRMLDGQLLHRDFYSCYGPAQYAIVAALFKLFGPDIMVARAYGLLVFAAIIATVFDTLSMRIRLPFSTAATAIVAAWFFVDYQSLYPVFPCILLALWGSNLLLRALQRSGDVRHFVFAGLCTGLTTMFRYDAGFFLMLAHLAAIGIITGVNRSEAARTPTRTLSRDICAKEIAYCGGIAVIFVPLAAAFVAVAPLQSFIADIVDYPRKYYFVMRALPFPGLHEIVSVPLNAVVYLPLLAALLAMLGAASSTRSAARLRGASRRTMHFSAADRAFLIIYGLVSFLFFFKGVVRVSPLHMLLANVPAVLILAMVVEHWWQGGRSRRGLAVCAALLVLGPAVNGGYRQLAVLRADVSGTLGGWALAQSGVDRFLRTAADGCSAVVNAEPLQVQLDYLRAARYVQQYTPADEHIYVGLGQHDRIFINAVAFYYFAQRLPGTHWHTFDPGLQNRADIQLQMIAELRRQGTRWLVLDHSFDAIRENNGSGRSSGVTLLDDFIRAHYREAAVAGQVHVWLRNEAALPAPTALACVAAPVSSSV